VSPDETALAAQVAALPGFPRFDDIGSSFLPNTLEGGYPLWFANDLVWVGINLDARGEWIRVPLLTHGGTAGILLGMLGPALREIRPPGWTGPAWTVWTNTSVGLGERYIGDSLGVAVARALIVVGRAA
jgi:hypothetical protein